MKWGLGGSGVGGRRRRRRVFSKFLLRSSTLEFKARVGIWGTEDGGGRGRHWSKGGEGVRGQGGIGVGSGG